MPDILLYSSGHCLYCVAAKNFLKNKGLSFREVRVDADPEERQAMQARTRRSSVPQIVIGDTVVGGFEDLLAFDRDGRLQSLLESSS